MPKVTIIGAGNVGGLTAARIQQANIADVVLIDIFQDLAKAKAKDLSDSGPALGGEHEISATADFNGSEDSDIIILTAGLPRKPGMSREDLLKKNAAIVKDIIDKIKGCQQDPILIMVTNPVDIMAYLAIKHTGFKPKRTIGFGASLDSSRFSNLISQELKINQREIQATVIGAHGEGMLPLPRFTKVKNKPLDKLLPKEKIEEVIKRTINRGAEIVSLYGQGSAYFAPSAALLEMVKAILLKRKVLCASAYLQGVYGLSDICIGVPCVIGKHGIEKIIELDLNTQEKAAFEHSASLIRDGQKILTTFY